MGVHIKKATQIECVGNKPKIINEFIGLVNSGSSDVSIARMQSPSGWTEPAQTPDFDEYTLVLKGEVHITTPDGTFVIKGGEAFIAEKGKKVQYSTPGPDGAEYVAVCLPAFSPETVHREDD
jgi:ethanolamine utilization protein EutQ (cupin superfamily)